ncbi:nucleotide exchange factor GrpE [Actinomyces sp. zg-332]|uniref:nucleotide exchange factor GrpE n=1 Tax=Actinomyces sp. zg-332 TaxID=2708340 RepID=UPI001423B09C|nr:nucleotide exchange factor GrpE [Actinomyces sp. zg-332]QPK94366.1 nucleotide exchange factor GrpE [Actinomyces sp. zg-332]
MNDNIEDKKTREALIDDNTGESTQCECEQKAEETLSGAENETGTTDSELADESAKTPEEENLELKEKIDKLTDELARSNADYYNLQNEYSNYVRRSKSEISTYKLAGVESVVESLLSVFDDIDAAKKHGDLTDGPFVAIVNKIETALKTDFKIERFGNFHDEFDPNMHEALLVTPNPSSDKEEIGDIIQSGWKIEDKIIRAAKVVVFTPSE